MECTRRDPPDLEPGRGKPFGVQKRPHHLRGAGGLSGTAHDRHRGEAVPRHDAGTAAGADGRVLRGGECLSVRARRNPVSGARGDPDGAEKNVQTLCGQQLPAGLYREFYQGAQARKVF